MMYCIHFCLVSSLACDIKQKVFSGFLYILQVYCKYPVLPGWRQLFHIQGPTTQVLQLRLLDSGSRTDAYNWSQYGSIWSIHPQGPKSSHYPSWCGFSKGNACETASILWQLFETCTAGWLVLQKLQEILRLHSGPLQASVSWTWFSQTGLRLKPWSIKFSNCPKTCNIAATCLRFFMPSSQLFRVIWMFWRSKLKS